MSSRALPGLSKTRSCIIGHVLFLHEVNNWRQGSLTAQSCLLGTLLSDLCLHTMPRKVLPITMVCRISLSKWEDAGFFLVERSKSTEASWKLKYLLFRLQFVRGVHRSHHGQFTSALWGITLHPWVGSSSSSKAKIAPTFVVNLTSRVNERNLKVTYYKYFAST